MQEQRKYTQDELELMTVMSCEEGLMVDQIQERMNRISGKQISLDDFYSTLNKLVRKKIVKQEGKTKDPKNKELTRHLYVLSC